MITIAHIVNPFVAEEGTDNHVAQPITLETMQIARAYAADVADVSLFTAQYPQARPLVPQAFTLTPDLDRAVTDLASFAIPRRLPLIKDLLDRLYAASEADYFIYSNVDIALMPHFYTAVAGFIARGYDAFTITKRIISKHHRKVSEIPLMQSEVGLKHAGHDCFVFRRDAYPGYKLGHCCVGAPGVGSLLLWNLALNAKWFDNFLDLHLTFHLGNDVPWMLSKFDDYTNHNHEELRQFTAWLQQAHGPINKAHPLYRYLYPMRHVIGSQIKIKRNWALEIRIVWLKGLQRLADIVNRIELL